MSDAQIRYCFQGRQSYSHTHLKFTWKGQNSGHIISADRDGLGALRCYDPQSGKHCTAIEFMERGIKRMRFKGTTYGLKYKIPAKLLSDFIQPLFRQACRCKQMPYCAFRLL
jgi:hypothetical protein